MIDLRDKNTAFSKTHCLQCGDKILQIDYPVVMGILNLTPDSFYDGGRYHNESEILQKASEMLEEGASILDIGAVSTRPGAAEVSAGEELHRLLPVLKILRKTFPSAIISIDTYRSEVVRIAAAEGAGIINDISAGRLDDGMLDAVALSGLPYVLMHMQGNPGNMQINPTYQDIGEELISFFSETLIKLGEHGIRQVILDPGFGFGKTLDNNYAILRNLNTFMSFGRPLLVGISRKSMLYRLLGTDAEGSLNATGIVHALALLKGANILRVHDVREAMQSIRLVDAFLNGVE